MYPFGGQANAKNEDCYFFYYSNCTKGQSCPYRHEPAALSQEVQCKYWKKGQCTKPHCIFRYYEDFFTMNGVSKVSVFQAHGLGQEEG